MDKDRIRTFAEQVYRDMAGTMTVGMAYIGVETGLFRAMAGNGPMLPEDVVAASGLQPRYVEEWLKGVTTAGYLEPRAGDRLEDNIHPLGTVYYGFSLIHCMTQSLGEGGPRLGTCTGPAQTIHLLRRSGFNEVEPLDIKSQTHLFYAARA